MLHQAGIGVVGPVFRAHDPGADRIVAVKAITLDMLPEVATELRRELQRVAGTRIDHAAVVAIFDSGIESGRPFVVADYIAGESLDIARRHRAPASFEDAVHVLGDIAGAIDAAWAAGLGHGALHPRDIFIVPSAGPARVTGFGIAPALERVGLNAPIRRPYTAPERVAHRAWDVRADVYTLAALAQDLLGNRRSGADEQDAPLSAVAPERREEVREVLGRALSSDPVDRFASAMAFVHALAAIAATTSDHVAAAPVIPVLGEAPVPAEPGPPLPQSAERVESASEPFVPVPPPQIDEVSLRPAVSAAPQVVALRRHDVFVPAARPVRPTRRPRAPYPWAAIVAVAIAGLAVGAAGGYGLGRRATLGSTSAISSPAPPPADTEVAVTSVPPSTAPVEPQLDEVRPASRLTTVGPGRIVVRSVPAGALVTVDGRHSGETPVTVSDLAFGAHTVVVARPGYVPRTERVTLSMRDAVRQLTVELRPGMEVRDAHLGSVYVDSRPRGARVSIDGRLVGTTPLSVPELAAGEHRVQVELAGYLTHASMVTVRGGEQSRVTVTLGRQEQRR